MTNQFEAEELPTRRWLGRRGGLIIAAVALAVWLYLLLVNSLIFKSQAVIPLAIIIGSFTVASAFVYTMAYRVGPRDGITAKLILFAFVVGGGIAMFVDYTPEAIVDRLTGGVAGHPSLLQVTYVGPIEELIKGIAVVLIGRRVARKSMRNGLLVGGAVGFGFSGFENLGYGLRSWLGAYGAPGIPGLISNTVLRELTGPVGHPLWTALLGAAIFAAWGQRRVGPRLAVLGTYLGVSFLHSAWDSADRWLALLANDPSLTGGYNVEAWIFVAVVGIVAWRIVSLRAKRSNLGFIAREPLEQPLIDGTR